MINLILKFFVSTFWIKFSICKFIFFIFSKFSFCFFKPKPNLRVNALSLKAIEWILALVDKFNRNLKEVQKTLMSCSLMEVDIDKNVEFRICDKTKNKDESCEVKKLDSSSESDIHKEIKSKKVDSKASSDEKTYLEAEKVSGKKIDISDTN